MCVLPVLLAITRLSPFSVFLVRRVAIVTPWILPHVQSVSQVPLLYLTAQMYVLPVLLAITRLMAWSVFLVRRVATMTSALLINALIVLTEPPVALAHPYVQSVSQVPMLQILYR